MMNSKLRWIWKKYYILLPIPTTLIIFAFYYGSNEIGKVNDMTKNRKMNSNVLIGNVFSNNDLRGKLLKQKLERLTRNMKKSRSIYLSNLPPIDPYFNVHIFYYSWYGNKRLDGSYRHWNHTYLPNWKKVKDRVYPTGFHDAPVDIGSNFYPQLGCYSSNDPTTIQIHLKQIREAGVGVVAISWNPPDFKDSPNDLLPTLFDVAIMFGLKLCLHIEPYQGRNPVNLLDHLKLFLMRFGDHPALYKVKKPLGKKEVPLFYVYDSYLTPDIAWKEILSKKGNLSIRNTEFDAVFIGLLVDLSHRSHIRKSHFNGFYTYFAANSFSYGSTWKNWHSLSKFASQNDLIFIPSVGPGYIDTQIRPWNNVNTRHRRHGQYYDVAWRSAISSDAAFISITSFNEWHEGTQIEPAIAKNILGFTYLDYEPEGPNFYLNLTKWWIQQYHKSTN